MSRFDQAIPFDPTLAKPARPGADAVPRDPDTQLMIQFQQGQQDAFELLVRRNQAKVYSVLYRFLGASSECEDLTQEVFLRVFRSAGRYVPSAKFSTWLYRIAANLALNSMRSRGRGRVVSLSIEGDSPGEAFQRGLPDTRYDGPETDLARRELADQVAAAVAQLPDKQRIAIVLNKYEGLCYEDIAGVLNCSTMAVKSLLSRARCNLRDRLARYIATGQSTREDPTAWDDSEEVPTAAKPRGRKGSGK